MWGVIGGSRRSRASGGAAAGDWAEGGLVGCWWAAGGLLHWPTAGGHSAGAGQEAGSPWPMRCWLQLQLCGPGVKASSSACHSSCRPAAAATATAATAATAAAVTRRHLAPPPVLAHTLPRRPWSCCCCCCCAAVAPAACCSSSLLVVRASSLPSSCAPHCRLRLKLPQQPSAPSNTSPPPLANQHLSAPTPTFPALAARRLAFPPTPFAGRRLPPAVRPRLPRSYSTANMCTKVVHKYGAATRLREKAPCATSRTSPCGVEQYKDGQARREV
ncbi:hypothetical protein J3E72DRAFT_273945 [Bipolaris maydis]|nr:hypothetical protein J3E72DRAFT_273945 [Bipolaris maydis]